MSDCFLSGLTTGVVVTIVIGLLLLIGIVYGYNIGKECKEKNK